MIQPAREIIFGVCDKTGSCDSYFGFFKREEDAKKEVKIQADRLKDNGLIDFIGKIEGRKTQHIDVVRFDQRDIERHRAVAEVLNLYGDE